jgi:urate oxidase
VTYRVAGSTLRLTGLPVLGVVRRSDRHIVQDLSVDVELAGATASGDAVARAVLGLAAGHAADGPEPFAGAIARHCVVAFDDAVAVTVEVRARGWEPLAIGGRARGGDHIGDGGEVRVARVTCTGGMTVRTAAGVQGMRLMTSAEPVDAAAGMLQLRLAALWTYGWSELPFHTQWQQVRRALAEAYAECVEPPGARLATALAEAVLDESPAVHRVRIRLAVSRRSAVDMAPYGLENDGTVFGGTVAPREVHRITLEHTELTE